MRELRQRKLWTVLELVPGLVLRLMPVNCLVRVNFTSLRTPAEVLGEQTFVFQNNEVAERSQRFSSLQVDQTVNRNTLHQLQLSKTTLLLLENPLKGTTAQERRSYSHTTV